MAREISRKSFLKGAAAGALGLGAMNLFGGMSEAKAEEKKNEITWAAAADMIVVGGGGAGFTAAIEALRAGSSVLILEKSALCGGDTLRSGGMIMVGGSQLQKDRGYDDSAEQFARTELRYCGEYADHGMVQEMCEKSVESLQFMEGLGRVYTDLTPMMPVWSYDTEEDWRPRTHWNMTANTGHFAALEAEVRKHGNAAIKVNCEVVHLIQNEAGEVIGVETKDGKKYRANKAVLLATASFGHNKEMSRRYNQMNYWALNYEDVFNKPGAPGGCPQNTGDGIRMAQEIGADLALTTSNCISDAVALSFDSFRGSILVNNLGQRFVQENAHWGYVNQMCFAEAQKQGADKPGEKLFWLIADEASATQNIYTACILGGIEQTASKSYHPLVKKADTLEALAEETGLPKDALLNSVARWNGMVAKGEDTDFGRRDYDGRQDLVAIAENGPYYAFPYMPYSMGAFGGLRADKETRILDTAGNPIPRLYGAGTVTSGMWIAPFYNACGWAILGTVHWGRKAGVNIAALEPWTTETVVAEVEEDTEAQIAAAVAAATGSYKAGEYMATVAGRNGDMKVTVTFNDTAIVGIVVNEHVETIGIGDVAIEDMSGRILLAQSADVDATSGATMTANAIIEAVKNCMAQAAK